MPCCEPGGRQRERVDSCRGACRFLPGSRLIPGAAQTLRLRLMNGTLALNNTGSEPCDAARYYTFRANPVTQRLEMCRP
jgi:hypothetical protein